MWESVTVTPLHLLAVLVGIFSILLFWNQLKGLVRLAGRTAAGLAALALFSPVGNWLGVSLGVNLVNALVLGVLGVPGFGLLMMLNWLVVS